MGIKDVAGVSRPGVFETLPSESGAAELGFTPQRGTAVSVTFKTSGQRATATPEYRGPNRADPWTQEYRAVEQGAATPAPDLTALSWPTPARAVRRGR